MKPLFALIFAAIFLVSCESNRPGYVQTYHEDGTPSWVGETFTNPYGYWAGYNDEKGFYAWGGAKYDDRNVSTNAAELDAKIRLLDFISGTSGSSKGRKALVGVQRVDRFIADDGTVYVLLFISNKNVKK